MCCFRGQSTCLVSTVYTNNCTYIGIARQCNKCKCVILLPIQYLCLSVQVLYYNYNNIVRYLGQQLFLFTAVRVDDRRGIDVKRVTWYTIQITHLWILSHYVSILVIICVQTSSTSINTTIANTSDTTREVAETIIATWNSFCTMVTTIIISVIKT